MALPSASKVRTLGGFYESDAWNLRHVSRVFNEYEQEVIHNGLRKNVDELQQKVNPSQDDRPAIPPRPIRSMAHKTVAVATNIDREVEEEGSHGNVLSNDKEPETQPTMTSHVQELNQQRQQVRQETQKIAAQHEACEKEVQALNDRIVELEDEKIDLIAAGSSGKELRAQLKLQIEELRGKLEEANSREKVLREELEKSRRTEEGLRKKLAEAELHIIRQSRDNIAREVELQRQCHHPSPGDMAFIQQQRHEKVIWEQDIARLQEQNRDFAHARSMAQIDAQKAQQEVARLQKKGGKDLRRGLSRSRSNKAVVSLLAFTTT